VITITGSKWLIFTGPQIANFKGSKSVKKYVSTKKPQYKTARENLGVYSILCFFSPEI